MPIFWESGVDSCFAAFEGIANALRWPHEVWTLLTQCRLQGKAQEIVAAFLLEQSLNFESVKVAILQPMSWFLRRTAKGLDNKEK